MAKWINKGIKHTNKDYKGMIIFNNKLYYKGKFIAKSDSIIDFKSIAVERYKNKQKWGLR